MRNFDQAWFHNLDSMVQAASGHVTFRQWQPPTGTGDRGVYMLIAAAANPTPRARGSSGLAGSGRTGR